MANPEAAHRSLACKFENLSGARRGLARTFAIKAAAATASCNDSQDKV